MVYIFTLIFLALDLGSKALAEALAPNNMFFKLHYNPNMALSIPAHDFIKLGLPLFLMPLLFILSKNIKNEKLRPWFLSLSLAGAVGNYIGRFSDKGVVDFINMGLFVCNLADVFLNVAMIIVLISQYQEYVSKREKITNP